MQALSTHLQKLRDLLDDGIIDQPTFDAAMAKASLQGGGAIAQGAGAQAIGAGGVAVQGNNHGVINLGLLIQQAAMPGAGKDDLRRAYLARILKKANQSPLFAGDVGNGHVLLSSVYTALLTQRSETDDDKALSHLTSRETRKLSALDVLNAERKLVLLGGPGSGKSTFVTFVALSLAGELLGVPDTNLATLTAPLPAEKEGDQERQAQRWDHGALLPVQVTLRDLASRLPPPGAALDAGTVWRFICDNLDSVMRESFAPHLHEELLQRGGLVLLDGLDEVPDALNRREQIKQAVQEFAATFHQCRFLVTSRTYAYQRQDWKLDGFAEAHLALFTLGQIRRFVDLWYDHMVELARLTETAARERAALLKRTAERNERIRELAERPLLLTLIAQLQTQAGGALPEKREELYDRAVEMLLNQWESMKPRADGATVAEPSLAEWLNAEHGAIRKQLNRLAFEAHRDQPQLTGAADIRQENLINALLAASANRADVKVKRLEEYLRDRAGILAAHGVGMVQFPHRSFQEYLAACHLTDDEFPEKLADLARNDPNRWREVALLAGAKAARGSTLSAWALAEALCLDAPPTGTGEHYEPDHWGALLAGQVLAECADPAQVAPRNRQKLANIRAWQIAVMRRNPLPAVERALAGRTLATLADPRPEVTTLDGMAFCYVPPGAFTMGDDRNDDEKPQHPVNLAYPYFIARFPVSVAQWREYVERSGHAPGDASSLHGRSNDPVVHVSWKEALRFCDFLTQAWREMLPADWVVTLPSEAEWEKAARGGERIPANPAPVTARQLDERLKAAADEARNPFPRRDYPWGEGFDENRANTTASSIGETSAVGCYPLGASPYGCEEMSGNIWEWTRSLYGESWMKPEFVYPYDPEDRRREDADAGEAVLRVVRGGGWANHTGNARCAYRDWIHPDDRYDNLGFRVVLRFPPV